MFTAGSVSAGNLQKYLPFILSEIQANPKRQYLLLHSLKEVITCHYGTPEAVAILEPHVTLIWYGESHVMSCCYALLCMCHACVTMMVST